MKTPKGEINDKVLELVKDEEILAKMAETKSPEECYDVVKDKIDISFEDFTASMTVAMNYVQESQSGLLSDDDLDQVAGGKKSDIDIGEMVGLGLSAIGTAAGVIGAIVAAAT